MAISTIIGAGSALIGTASKLIPEETGTRSIYDSTQRDIVNYQKYMQEQNITRQVQQENNNDNNYIKYIAVAGIGLLGIYFLVGDN